MERRPASTAVLEYLLVGTATKFSTAVDLDLHPKAARLSFHTRHTVYDDAGDPLAPIRCIMRLLVTYARSGRHTVCGDSRRLLGSFAR